MNNPAKILVIDDTEDIGIMLKMMLTFKGYDVIVLDTTEGVLEIIREQNIDLVIMDLYLSGVIGIDICTAIKNDPAIQSTPLIMMSAHPDAKTTCLQAGANDFIFKPFDLEEMLSSISKLL